MPVGEYSAVKPVAQPLRIALWAAATLAYGSLIAFLLLISLQLYRWFRDGEWTHIGTADGIRDGLTRCCAAGDGTGTLSDLVRWLDSPVEWLGLHRVLELVPASLTLFGLSIFGNFIFLYCRDRIASQAPDIAPEVG